MLVLRKKGLLYSGFSFLAAFFVTHGAFEWLCDREDYSEERAELLWELREVDTHPIGPTRLRDEFVYTRKPWKVVDHINNASFTCPFTSTIDPIKIVVFIKSAANYSRRRTAVRETWGKVSHIENMIIHVVFVVGSTTLDIQKKIDEESHRFGDVLQFIGLDDYRHIGYKVLAGMQWAKGNLPEDHFYASSDDDLLVNFTDLPKQMRLHMKMAREKIRHEKPRMLPKLNLETLLTHMPIVCVFCYRVKRERPERDPNSVWGKYYIDRREYPMEYLPPFCLGGWYLMPADRVGKLYDASRKERALPMDDVWVTGILRMKITPNDIEAIDSSAAKHKSIYVEHLEGDFGEAKSITKLISGQWDNIWKKIKTKKHCLRDEF